MLAAKRRGKKERDLARTARQCCLNPQGHPARNPEHVKSQWRAQRGGGRGAMILGHTVKALAPDIPKPLHATGVKDQAPMDSA